MIAETDNDIGTGDTGTGDNGTGRAKNPTAQTKEADGSGMASRINEVDEPTGHGNINSDLNASVDADEISRFAAIAEEWWDPNGKFKPLHQLNPVRLSYLRDKICDHFDRDRRSNDALTGLQVLDIGCGGGLLSEPLARQGGDVTGIDPSEKTVRVARAHAHSSGAPVIYESTTVEALVDRRRQFDVVIAMEVVEHVTDVNTFVSGCAALVAPGGLFVASTINRTLKAYALAIVGAERVMRWLPVGTHEYDKLVRPKELEAAAMSGGLSVFDKMGMVYNPLFGDWRLAQGDLDVNYLISATKPLEDQKNSLIRIPRRCRGLSNGVPQFGDGFIKMGLVLEGMGQDDGTLPIGNDAPCRASRIRIACFR